MDKEFSVISFEAQQHSGCQVEIFSLLQLQILVFPFASFWVDQKLRVEDKQTKLKTNKQAEEPIIQNYKIISLWYKRHDQNKYR